MYALAVNTMTRPYRPMPLTHKPQRAEQQLLGRAIRQLRKRADLPQSVIADALEMTTQAWQKYEAGERKFAPEKIPAILKAIGATTEELESQRLVLIGRDPAEINDAPKPPFHVEVRGRTQFGPEGFGESEGAMVRQIDLRQLLGRVGAVEIAGDEMSPWAEPGEIVLYDRDRYPKRGQGCVVELKTGEQFVRKYERSDGSTLFVRVLHPEERVDSFAMTDVRGVYAIRLRGD